MKVKLALVGRNISHSRSPEMYQKLMTINFDYELLDFENSNQIPRLGEILSIYNGINITSPYKEHFLSEVECLENSSILGAINCIRNNHGRFQAINTDYFALCDLLERYNITSKYEVLVLGDGVMSRVVSHALKSKQLSHRILSRKLTDHFGQLNILELVNQNDVVVINTCAREYCYRGPISKTSLFWDLNYSHEVNRAEIGKKCQYIDGLDLLFVQAEYAVKFWSGIIF